jgi:hypothetical protein
MNRQFRSDLTLCTTQRLDRSVTLRINRCTIPLEIPRTNRNNRSVIPPQAQAKTRNRKIQRSEGDRALSGRR